MASNNLSLPFLTSGQAQKHVSVNEALTMLDALVQLSATSYTTSTPTNPGEGERYLIKAGATGEWQTHENAIALWNKTTWQYFQPQKGWRIWIESEGREMVWHDDQWTSSNSFSDRLGINTPADDVNQFAVASDASLFTHSNADHRLILNKMSPEDTTSITYQTNFNARAETGIIGDDSFKIRVTHDGSNWLTGLSVDSQNAVVTTPGIRSGEVTLNDDTSTLLTPPASGGLMAINLYAPQYPQVPYSALLSYDTGATPKLLSLASGGKVGFYQSALTGNTGTATQLNIGASSDGLWIENRFGSQQTYRYVFLC